MVGTFQNQWEKGDLYPYRQHIEMPRSHIQIRDPWKGVYIFLPIKPRRKVQGRHLYLLLWRTRSKRSSFQYTRCVQFSSLDNCGTRLQPSPWSPGGKGVVCEVSHHCVWCKVISEGSCIRKIVLDCPMVLCIPVLLWVAQNHSKHNKFLWWEVYLFLKKYLWFGVIRVLFLWGLLEIVSCAIGGGVRWVG